MIKKKILLGLGSAITIASPIVTVVACGSTKKTSTKKVAVPTVQKNHVVSKNKKQKGINIGEIYALVSNGGIFSLPTYLTKDSLSIEAIIDELALGESGTLVKGLNALKGIVWPTVIIKKISAHKKIILKLIDGGLKSLDGNDINDIKILIKEFVGGKYLGTNKVLEALINGVKNEIVNPGGSLSVFPSLIKTFVNDLVESLVPRKKGGGTGSSMLSMIEKDVDKYLDPISKKFFGTWENFLTNEKGILKNIDDLKFNSLFGITKTGELESEKLKLINKALGGKENDYLANLKLILSNYQSVKDKSRKILSSIDHMKTLKQFKGLENILDLFNLDLNQPLVHLDTDDYFLDVIEVARKISDYLEANWAKITKDEFIKGGKKVSIADELNPFFLSSKWDEHTKKLYPTLLRNIVTQAIKKDMHNISAINYELNNIKYVDKLKKAIKNNKQILGSDILAIPTFAGKSLLGSHTNIEFKKTLAYLQAILQRAIVYIGYQDQENKLRGLFNLIAPKFIIPLDILGSEIIFKLATLDLSKPISSDIISKKDAKLILRIITLSTGDDFKSIITTNDLQTIFKTLIGGFKIKGDQMDNFKIVLTKILGTIPIINKEIPSLVSSILFGR